MQLLSDTVKGLMPFSNDIATLEDETTFDQGEDYWFLASKDSFVDNFDGGPNGKHDESLNDNWGNDNDVPSCNHVESGTKHVGGVDLGDFQCDDPIYNNPIASDNMIHSLETLLDDNDQERVNAKVVIEFVIDIDATHKKGRFRGVLFVVVYKDVNKCIYFVAFGIGPTLRTKTCGRGFLPSRVMRKCKRKVVDFCSDYYKTTYLVEGYVGSIHPIGHSSD
ncbi:Uncharacterized protein TCM_010279 [Theobroma cacao]|uniref:Uncharacterized protein n=1 Tax=Theobroma cacao TaxID=3641 RepID=A0A061E6Z1_THECC|nr:Uncharacterized protein TCM_010279 [Theobroma cacao]